MITALLIGVLILALFNYVVTLHREITRMHYGRNALGELKRIRFDD